MSERVTAFIQARMSSRRFPGKVLAPFLGRPVISHVVAAVRQALPATAIVVVTSTEASDDPLAAYAPTLGVPVFRGALDDVFRRFRDCLEAYPCDWVLRISGDSPLLNPRIVTAVVEQAGRSAPCDIVTTVFPRTFPSGQNAELIRAATLAAIDPRALNDGDREHVTRYFYRNADRFRIVNVSSNVPSLADRALAIDSVQDLARLEASADAEVAAVAAAFAV